MNNEEIWQATLAQIQLNISPANFATWFKNTGITEQNDGKATISITNSFAKEWIQNKYGKTILKILHDLNPQIKEIEYQVGKMEAKILRRSTTVFPAEGQLGLQEFQNQKEANINSKYTFDSFVIGPFNELAHAAGWAVSQNPGKVYNPLFVYGRVGLGKTHLLQAIGNEIVTNLSLKKVQYIPSERFTSGLISAIRKKDGIESFKAKYRNVDVLIFDDIQFLSGKEKTQEEFFHIFNHLYENNKQIVLSSDRPPKAISALAERLRSRFEGGMIADISYPDYETRLAILKTKCQERKLNFSDDILDYIASNIEKNVRELEGALLRLLAHQNLTQQVVDVGIAKSLLQKLVLAPKKLITPKAVIKAVADFYDLKEKDVLSSSRRQEVVKPRQIAMYLLREELKNSYPFIGQKFGGRDHTTAIYAYEKMSKEIKKNSNTAEEIGLIRQQVFSA
ncbi:MAG: chromosomal replication initiator protein DnaA [Patescibacteria group bacterium]|nr:chromosomal replication initiator protein DnaA [Patescibacteria group bacterium]MBU1877018.1 chromosomal replication initiator protein DnaA [Patescibacteria group bacterium]